MTSDGSATALVDDALSFSVACHVRGDNLLGNSINVIVSFVVFPCSDDRFGAVPGNKCRE